MDTLRDFYRLSEILGDDLYKVANAIQTYSLKEIAIETIVNDLGNLELDEYAKVISYILDHTCETIRNAGKGITFKDETSYIQYLQHIMIHAGIEFIPFVRKI